MTLRGFVFPEAWRYRDYVIDAFRRDLPFDQFVSEQVAGDLLPSSSWEEKRRQTVATTFLVLGNTNFEDQDKKQLEMDFVDEQLDVLGKAFLAQTVSCARCHDHKFDPISTRDYYALAGILRGATALDHANVSKWIEAPLPVSPELQVALEAHEGQLESLDAELATLKGRREVAPFRSRQRSARLGAGGCRSGRAPWNRRGQCRGPCRRRVEALSAPILDSSEMDTSTTSTEARVPRR